MPSKTERRILAEEKKIKQTEEKILKAEERIEATLAEGNKVVKDFRSLRDNLARRISRHKFIYTLLISLGIVMVWRGLWETTESFISSAFISLALGLILLWVIKKHTDLH